MFLHAEDAQLADAGRYIDFGAKAVPFKGACLL